MFYFAYGSNLNLTQMKKRCKDCKYIKSIKLHNYSLTFRSRYRAADIEKKKNSIVVGALFDISKHDEKKLDLGIAELYKSEKSKPKSIIANTIKGKGISFMENSNEWHYRRLDNSTYKAALTELELKR